MYREMKNQIIQNMNLGPITKVIFESLISFANKKGYCYPSQDQLASKVNLCRQTIAKHLKIISNITINDLPVLKIVKSKYKDAKYSNNRYFVPFIKNPDPYIQECNNNTYKELCNEYYKMVLEESINNDSDLNFGHITPKFKSKYNNNNDVKSHVQRISETLSIKPGKVFNLLANLGHQLSEGTTIYNLKAYISKSLFNLKRDIELEDNVLDIYNVLGFAGSSGLDIASIDYDRFAELYFNEE